MTDKVPPVQEGQVVTAECISKGKKGDGVFKVNGYILVVPKTEVGQSYSIRVNRVLPTVGFGEIA